jgi:predicted lipoprotein
LEAMLQGLQRAYLGGEGAGLDDYLRNLNPALETRVTQQFQKAVTALRSIDAPLEVAVTNGRASVEAAHKAVHDLEILFKVDVASALGVTITFNSNDGD